MAKTTDILNPRHQVIFDNLSGGAAMEWEMERIPISGPGYRRGRKSRASMLQNRRRSCEGDQFPLRKSFLFLLLLASLAVVIYDSLLLYQGEINFTIGSLLLLITSALMASNVMLMRRNEPGLLHLFEVLTLIVLIWYASYSFVAEGSNVPWMLIGLVWIVSPILLLFLFMGDKFAPQSPPILVWGIPCVTIAVTLSALLAIFTLEFIWTIGILLMLLVLGVGATESGSDR